MIIQILIVCRYKVDFVFVLKWYRYMIFVLKCLYMLIHIAQWCTLYNLPFLESRFAIFGHLIPR